MPPSAAATSTNAGVSMSVRLRIIRIAARSAKLARMPQSMARPPRRSPSAPNIGAASVPSCCSEPNVVSRSTDPVPTITYQPRISVSISKAQDVRRSAGHWKRKLRTRSGAKVNDGSVRLIAPRAGIRDRLEASGSERSGGEGVAGP